MKRVERSVEVQAPAERAFAYLADLENLAAWQSGIRSARQTSPGPMAVGTTAHVVRELMGQRVEAPLTVTSLDPPHHLELASEVSGMRVTAQLAVASLAADRSRVSFALEIAGSGMTAFMEPIVASVADADLAASLERLRQELSAEGQPPEPALD